MHGIEPSAKEQEEGCMQKNKKRRLQKNAIQRRKTLLARVAFFKSKATSIGPAIMSTLSRPAILGTVAIVLTCLSWLAAGHNFSHAFQPRFRSCYEPRWQPTQPPRHFPPCPGATYLIDRMISRAGGWRRWRRIRTISQLNHIELLDKWGKGKVEKQWDERFFFAKVRGCPHLVNIFKRDDKTITFGTNGNEFWALVDDRPRCDPELLEEATRRLREVWFWLRFPFSLRETGTEATVGGSGIIEGGRIAVWYLDVMPAKTGDGWPLDRLRLVINQSNYRLEGVVYPKMREEFTNFRARYSNHVNISRITLPHIKEVENEEGVIARETVRERLYNVPLNESIFHMPIFEHY